MSNFVSIRSAVFALAIFFVQSEVFAAEVHIEFKSGRKITGELVEENDFEVIVKLKFGSITYLKSEIKKMTRGDAAQATQGSTATPNKFDVVKLSNGLNHNGLIVKETGDSIEFDIVKLGKDGAKPMVIRMNFKKSNIKQVVRITEKQREALKTFLKSENKSTSNQPSKTASGMTMRAISRSVRISRGYWEYGGVRGKVKINKIALGKFRIETNISNTEFLKRIAYKMGSIFNTFEATLGAHRNQDENIRIIILDSLADYQSAIGYATEHQAHYKRDKGVVYAGLAINKYFKDDKKSRDDDSGYSYAQETLSTDDFAIWAEDDLIRKAFNDYKFALEERQSDLADLNERIMFLENERDAEIAELNEIPVRIGYVKKDPDVESISQSQKTRLLAEITNKYKTKLRPYVNKRNSIRRKSLKPLKNKFLDALTASCLERICRESFIAYSEKYLFDDNAVVNMPLWLSEGMAQYYAGLTVKRGKVYLDQPKANTVAILNVYAKGKEYCSVKNMLNASPKAFALTTRERGFVPIIGYHNYDDQFGGMRTKTQELRKEKQIRESHLNYFQSWLAVFIISTNNRLTYENIKTYIDDLCAGEDQFKAFEKFSGMTTHQMTEEMKKQVRTGPF